VLCILGLLPEINGWFRSLFDFAFSLLVELSLDKRGAAVFSDAIIYSLERVQKSS
jgi:hypothetical protein